MHLTRAILILSLLSPALSRAIPLDRVLDSLDVLDDSTREPGPSQRLSPSVRVLHAVNNELAEDGSSSSRLIDGGKDLSFVDESKERQLERTDLSDEDATLDAEQHQQQQPHGLEGDGGAGNGDGSRGAETGTPTTVKGSERRIVRRQAPTPSSTPSSSSSPTPSPTPPPQKKSKKPLIIGATLGAVALFLLSFFSCVCICCPGPAAGMSFGVGGKGTPAIARFSCSCWRHD